MTNDSLSSAFTVAPSRNSQHHDDDDSESEEITFLNPFAQQHDQNSTVRHRAALNATGQAREYSSTYRHVHNISTFGDSSSLAMPLSHPPLHLQATHSTTSGVLELEGDESSRVQEEDLLGLKEQDTRIITDSGLLLQHRQTPSNKNTNMPRVRPTFRQDDVYNHNTFRNNTPATAVNRNGHALEVDSGYLYASTHYNHQHSTSPAIQQAKRFLSYVKLWNAIFVVVLIIGTGVVIHSIRHEHRTARAVQSDALESVDASMQQQQQQAVVKEQIILRPLAANATIPHQQQQEQIHRRMAVALPQAPLSHSHGIRSSLHELRLEFQQWVTTHKKAYATKQEEEYRFGIWHDNHFKTIEKNERHGPCKLTGKPVFGSTYFKDLTTEEFTSQYLTGYKGPLHDELVDTKNRKTAEMFVPGHEEREEYIKTLHPSIRERHLQNFQSIQTKNPYQASSSCSFYDVSCWLQWFMYNYGYRIGSTMEPGYDSSTYPEAVDWREYGVVSSVHSQGSCGACWAITAVETIESAYALKTGTLMDLCETEVIVCEEDCEMCNGGWPQNAYDFNMEQGGLLAESSWSYDGDFLSALTAASDGGDDDKYNAEYVSSYRSDMCSEGGNRYAKVKGYGYATDRCVCYTDGTGCDCDEQNELKALQNVATYGPATVCLEASTWADYAGGILTADSGCSPAFLDMNHCVQAVGYAFVDSNANYDEDNADDGSGSGSGSKSGGSRDDGSREGYWIIRNQWSAYWGYDGYIFVAMGDNTCGVLNDMTQVYM